MEEAVKIRLLQLRQQLGIQNMIVLKNLRRQPAEIWLRRKWTELSPGDIELLLGFARPDFEGQLAEGTPGLFRAVAYLAGATIGDLAWREDVSEQAVLSSIKRAMGQAWDVREHLRQRQVGTPPPRTSRRNRPARRTTYYKKLSPDQISLLWDRFNELDPELLTSLAPHELQLIIANDGLPVGEVESSDVERVPDQKLREYDLTADEKEQVRQILGLHKQDEPQIPAVLSVEGHAEEMARQIVERANGTRATSEPVTVSAESRIVTDGPSQLSQEIQERIAAADARRRAKQSPVINP